MRNVMSKDHFKNMKLEIKKKKSFNQFNTNLRIFMSVDFYHNKIQNKYTPNVFRIPLKASLPVFTFANTFLKN